MATLEISDPSVPHTACYCPTSQKQDPHISPMKKRPHSKIPAACPRGFKGVRVQGSSAGNTTCFDIRTNDKCMCNGKCNENCNDT